MSTCFGKVPAAPGGGEGGLLPNPHRWLELMTKCSEGGFASWAEHPVCHSATLSLLQGWVFENGAGGGKEASQGNRHSGLLSQEPQRSHTWWKRLFLTMNLTMCR